MSDYLHIIKTKAYQNDSRLLKWIETLKNQGKTSSVFVLEDENKALKYSQNELDVVTTFLFFRKYFKKGKGFVFKIPEFSWRSLRFIKQDKAKIIVFHDLQHYLTLLILCLNKPRDRKIIWDLHELFHESLLKFSFSRKVLEFILSKVDCIVYTNEYRRNYTLEKLNYVEKKYVILNNYTDNDYIVEEKKSVPPALQEWLGNEKYIIWLGGGLKARNFLSFLKAYEKIASDYKLVMLGRPDNLAKKFIKEHNLNGRIYDTFVKPHEMLNYIDNAEFSVVLYKHSSPNNYYCEPNRLYQLVSRRIPVIVGNNPPMKNLVQKYKAGLVLEDDGSDFEGIYDAMEQLKATLDEYKTNLQKSQTAHKLSWENQFLDIMPTLNTL